MPDILQFTAAGAPRALSRAIEACADEKRFVSALVVPWESDRTRISMAVTSVKTDGWAIEHTNLGTITLTDLGNDRTRIAVISHTADHPGGETLTALLGGFARQIQQGLEAHESSGARQTS